MTDYDAPRLRAIDPSGCGCTECLTGEYKPLDRATDEDIQALLGGALRDHTDEHFLIAENTLSLQSRGFSVFADGRSWDVDTISLPVAVFKYDIHLSRGSFEQVLEGGGYPHLLGVAD